MIKTLSIIVAVLAVLHGLVHLMGLFSYFPLAKIADLPYKTALLAGRWEIGVAGMRVYSIFWLLTTLGFIIGGILMLMNSPAWVPVLFVSTVLSMVICVLDWQVAFRGFWIDLFFLLVVFMGGGLQYKPASFPTFEGKPALIETIPLPEGLPAPVDRFMRMEYGEQIPVYKTVVYSGRGTVRFMGITFPSRICFSHLVGQGYRHYMEATVWGYPLFKVNEQYLDGHTRLELPFGTLEDAPYTHSAANLGLWAEAFTYPAAFVTTPGARWEPIDENSARLFVPFGESEQSLVVSFDPISGDLTRIEALRHRDENSGEMRWWGDIREVSGKPVFGVTWEDEDSAWLVGTVEEYVFNADLVEYILQKGY